jgi:hypothetical protein
MLNIFIIALAIFPTSTATRTTNTPASGITRVVIISRAGSLTVTGRNGATEIRSTGKAEASSDAELAKTQIVASHQGSQLTIEELVPDGSFLSSSPTIDMEVTVPTGVPVVIRDGSGSINVNDTGDLDVTDGSGSIDIENVTGNVRITDGSGSIDVKKVSGSVTITDDGSGSVNVADVRGNFTVQQKGSGHIDYERIGGKVSVPKK